MVLHRRNAADAAGLNLASALALGACNGGGDSDTRGDTDESTGGVSITLTSAASTDSGSDIGPDEIPVAAVELDVKDAKLVVGEVQIAATVETSGRVRHLPGGAIVGEDLHARTRDLDITTDSGTSDGTWVRLADATARYEGGALKVDARGRVEDARPAAVHLTRIDPLIEAIPDLERIAPVNARVKTTIQRSLVELDVEAEQLGVTVATLWRRRDDHWRLAVWASGLTTFGFTASDKQPLRRPLVLVGKDCYQSQRRWVRQLVAPRQG